MGWVMGLIICQQKPVEAALDPDPVRECALQRRSTAMSRILITGSARGIGLQLTRQYLAAGHEVIAVCRAPGTMLPTLGCECIDGIELTRADDLDRLRAIVGERRIDILIHNAGMLHRESVGGLRAAADGLRAQFETNTLAPLLLTEALLANLGSGSKIAFITSRMGSIADNSSGGYYGYRMSKGALNVAGKSLAIDLKPRGIAVSLLHPGFVRTDMTGGVGDIDAASSAAQLIARIDALDLERSGRFWHANGAELPW
jgi:NAD(P)-dependent dehydrogenase (short-subunit alcohol dehydrogenase family)